MKLKRRKVHNQSIPWSVQDERKLLSYLKKEPYEIGVLKKLFPNRTASAINNKTRQLRLKHDLFGISYRIDKEDFTIKIAEKIKPVAVFDAYAGAGHQTFKWIETADTVFASEIMKSKKKQFEKTAVDNGFVKSPSEYPLWEKYEKQDKKIYFYIGDIVSAAAEIKTYQIKIDLLDLDTCGSTLPTLPTILVLLKPKHLVITHGEFHSLRFGRKDVLRRLLSHKDIAENPLPMNIEEMSKELDRAVKIAGIRAHNKIRQSFWLVLKEEVWLGSKHQGMLRRYYKVTKPPATADCINILSEK